MAAREPILVVCPGRGTYNRTELGYLARHHRARAAFVASVDAYREVHGETPVSALDGAARFDSATMTRGDNASALIFACAYADFLAIDRERYEVVAVTGNSMGWYIALGCAGALDAHGALHLVDTMGALMQDNLIGGQLVYPLVDEDWRMIPGRREELLEGMREAGARTSCVLHVSIDLGGMLVIAGPAEGLDALAASLPRIEDRFPMRLPNHAAFHTPLLEPVAAHARTRIGPDLFGQPLIPLVDGRGEIWRPHATRPAELYGYTLGHQVVAPYDFRAALVNAVREFAPARVVVLGPSASLGASVAQTLIALGWRGLAGRADFAARQREQPFVISMGIDTQRGAVLGT